MRARANGLKRVKLGMTTNSQVTADLEKLVRTGMYGGSVAEAAERLLCEGLRQVLKRQQSKLLES